MLDWVIIYSDGSTFSSDDGTWEEAPSWDVQIVIAPNEEVGRKLYTRNDYFIMVDGKPMNVDFTGLLDYLSNVFGIVKIGRMLQPEHYRSLVAQAISEPGMPSKSAFLPGEPKP